jgi:PTS system mannose-specific IIA component
VIGIVIVGLGAFAEALLDEAQQIVGPQRNCTAIGISIDDDLEKRRNEIRESITKNNEGDGVIIFSDMFGGTPSNLGMSLMGDPLIELISGVNVPMLIKTFSVRDGKSFSETVAAAQDAGRKYIYVASRVLNLEPASGTSHPWEDERKVLIALVTTTQSNLLKIQELIEKIDEVRSSTPGIGHNHPEDQLIEPGLLSEGIIATEILGEELNANKPRRKIIELCVLVLKRVSDGIKALVKWLAHKADRLVEGLVNSIAKAAGPYIIAKDVLGQLGPDLDKIIVSIRHWLDIVMHH